MRAQETSARNETARKWNKRERVTEEWLNQAQPRLVAAAGLFETTAPRMNIDIGKQLHDGLRPWSSRQVIRAEQLRIMKCSNTAHPSAGAEVMPLRLSRIRFRSVTLRHSSTRGKEISNIPVTFASKPSFSL
jgi:hypothetical protein